MRIKLILLFLLISGVSLYGQTKLDFKTVDSKTYSYYQNAQWDSLIDIGKQAHRNGIDYYYLNYRIGVAYFYKKNYRKAAVYLQEAINQNQQALQDGYLVELLHLSYVYGQRSDLAMDVSLPDSSNTTDPLTKSQISVLFGQGQFLNVLNSDIQLPTTIEYAELRYQKYMMYIGFDVQHRFSSSFNLEAGYVNMRFMNEGIFQQDSIVENEYYDFYQNNFFFLPEFSLGKYWQIRPALSVSISKGSPYAIIDTINGSKVFGTWDYHQLNAMLGLNVYRHIKNVKIGLNMGISNYHKRPQIQFGGNATYYPFGNLNLYTYTALSLKMEDGNKDLIFQQMIGFKTTSILWIELGGIFGKLKNYSDYSLAYGYNIPDDLSTKLYAKLILVFGNNINLFFEGQYLIKQTRRHEYYINGDFVDTKINYSQRNITGGLLWKF